MANLLNVLARILDQAWRVVFDWNASIEDDLQSDTARTLWILVTLAVPFFSALAVMVALIFNFAPTQ